MTTSRPIWVEYSGISNTDNYATYTIKINNNTIYTGKTWVDSNGHTSMRIDQILMDYLWKWEYNYDYSTQSNKPSCMVELTDNIPIIEDNNKGIFFKSDLYVVCAGQQKKINVEGGFDAPWDNKQDIPIQGLSKIGVNIPKIPMVLTPNYWLGAVAYLGEGVNDVYLEQSGESISLDVEGSGTIAFAVTLEDLFTNFTHTSDISIGDDEGKTPLAIVDSCPSDYYVSWIDNKGGWSSYGFDGNASIIGNCSSETIVDANGFTKNFRKDVTMQFNLYTGYLSSDIYAHLMTMQYARFCYVYDTKNDIGFYCIPSTNGLATQPSKSYEPQCFNITLTSINKKR